MAVDSRIQTTVTAGRSGKDAPYDFNLGPMMIVLLSCLAVAMCFTTLGLGFVNIARGMKVEKAAALVAASKPPINPDIGRPPDAQEWNRVIETEIRKLTERSASVEKQQGTLTRKLESSRLEVNVVRESTTTTKQRLAELQTQKTQIAGAVSELQTVLAGNSVEAARELQLRAQLEQQRSEAARQMTETERRIQELKKAIEDKKNTFEANARAPAGGSPTSFVECSREGIALLAQGEKFSVNDLKKSPAAFLKVVGNRQIQFLIRPDGFSSFGAARDIAESNGIAVGYEPIDANWRLKYR